MRENGSNPVKRLSKKTLFAYGCGDFASNLTNTFMGSYLSIFYTDVVGLAPAVVSMIMVIARVWDAINDPMFGANGPIQKKEDFVRISSISLRFWHLQQF